MKRVATILMMAFSLVAYAGDDPQHTMIERKVQMNPDVIFAGENSNWKVYYDKNITYYTQRNQAIVYLLIESKKERWYVITDKLNKTTREKYRYVVQRTDFDCSRNIYISDRVTYFKIDTGEIIYEDIDGEPHKVNPGSPVDAVFQLACAEMR